MSMTNHGLVAVVKSFHDLLVPSKDKDYSWRKFSKQLKGLNVEAKDADTATLIMGHRRMVVTVNNTRGKVAFTATQAFDRGHDAFALSIDSLDAWAKDAPRLLREVYGADSGVSLEQLMYTLRHEKLTRIGSTDSLTLNVRLYQNGMISPTLDPSRPGTAYSLVPSLALS